MMSKPLFAFLTAQVLYLQLYFTSGKLLKWPSIIVLVNYEFLVIFIKQEWLLANFVKGVENWLQSDQYKFGADCTFHGFLEHPNDISLSTMTIFLEHPGGEQEQQLVVRDIYGWNLFKQIGKWEASLRYFLKTL